MGQQPRPSPGFARPGISRRPGRRHQRRPTGIAAAIVEARSASLAMTQRLADPGAVCAALMSLAVCVFPSDHLALPACRRNSTLLRGASSGRWLPLAAIGICTGLRTRRRRSTPCCTRCFEPAGFGAASTVAAALSAADDLIAWWIRRGWTQGHAAFRIGPTAISGSLWRQPVACGQMGVSLPVIFHQLQQCGKVRRAFSCPRAEAGAGRCRRIASSSPGCNAGPWTKRGSAGCDISCCLELRAHGRQDEVRLPEDRCAFHDALPCSREFAGVYRRRDHRQTRSTIASPVALKFC
jgi:hypothetical protein